MRHWAFLPALCALPVAILATLSTTPAATLAPPFHGIARADRSSVAALRPVVKQDDTTSAEAKKKLQLLRSRAMQVGEPASRALVEILARHYATATIDSWSQADDDANHEPEGMLIGELATEDTARVLARAVADRRLATGLRRALVVALCRTRFPFAADALAPIACDRTEDPGVREAILCRLHRLGLPPPASLKDLIYEPYRGVDILAAATLAICGDVEAPSLVLDGLTMPRWNDDEQLLAHCAEAAHRITRKPLSFPRSYTVVPYRTREENSLARVAPHVAALEEWMAAHPAGSEFERQRREYLASPERARELRVRTYEDVVAAGEDFDLAAVSLWLTVEEAGEVEASLERLHRLTRLCEHRLGAAATPAEKLEVLNGLLGQPPVRERHDPRWGSRLSGVLTGDYGNCLARSTLYLGVGERLGFPIRPYVLPGHVYVAWEEDGFRRNIETTDRGRERPGDGTPASRRAVLSIHLSNRAAALIDVEAYAEAASCAKLAIAFDRGNTSAMAARALASWQTDLAADPRRDFDRILEIDPACTTYQLAAAEMALELGFPDDALRRAKEAAPSADASALMARALLDLGDAAEAKRIADAAAARWPDAGGVLAFLRFELDLDDQLDRADVSPFWKARALLRQDRPDLALVQLDGARAAILGERRMRLEGGTLYTVDEAERAQNRREFHLLEARALAKLGRGEQAGEALRAAEEAAPAVRETLEVRRLLETGR